MEMDGPVGANALDAEKIVGKPLDRVDGRLKVTGGAHYAYEMQQNALYGFVVEASIAKGRIASIETLTAERSPGVKLVLTYRDAPKQGTGNHREAHPVLTGPVVSHYGEPVAFVVAETFEQARAAAYLVKVKYDREKGQHALPHHLALARVPHQPDVAPADSEVGNFSDAYADAPVQIDVSYSTPLQSHAMMEPHATLAMWDGDKLILHTANQMLNQGQRVIAKTLNIPVGNVRLVSPFIGGGFGGKLWVNADAILAAIASRYLKRPVKVALTRQQIFHVTTHRSDTIQRVRVASDRDGRITAIGHDVFSGNLRSEQVYEAAALQTRSLYAGPNRLTRHRLVPLDIPVASSMRAPGEAVGLMALECAMDELANKLRLDPIELRIRNEPAEDPEKHIPYSSRHLVACMQEGARRFGWDKRNSTPGQVRDGRWLVGMGMSAATRGNPLRFSKANVRLDPDGIATVRMAMTDIGTGTFTILAQIAAEMLGLPIERVRVDLGDTSFPEAAGSGGSFGAASSGSALFVACQALREKLAGLAGMDPNTARFGDGHIATGERSVSLPELVGSGVEADGEIKPGRNNQDFSQQSYGAHFAEVGVDQDTGEVRLRRMLGVFAAGRVLNAKTARSQAIGGMVFGVGAALHEDLVLDPRFGHFVNHDLAEYHVPVHADIPASLEAVFLPELDERSNPLKSKGIGELGICGAGAAIANAVYNACGARIRNYPITLDKVLASLPDQG
ncbi:xanthine dehydrogenase family protein molybdopterin-binding subunit (plasmid) [Bradyrhizobium sp. 183]|uniref:xanthine dehydrogenase family protein molybdopterin-binding subunit n=1 Tax=unclassified Bradyrhizobium TaxID=2631580 RepID=UPI00200007FD|nr:MULTISPECIES: xanthine dehydrogenase family protein molybdopterin-binding subunit [unclassified Bradyrhizobium]UPJ84824.1 xanthine dehydrogenase family protein molybdopterin-binding subunit [Bradyrhizobium sp. 184]UPJ92663.1 xanthine dehydrogenase family protein molybdopterin-binding subunit [Bradyrhizobium sp. 183]